MEEFYSVNNNRDRIKVFKPFEEIRKQSPNKNAMLNSYGCVNKRATKTVMKGSRVKSNEDAR